MATQPDDDKEPLELTEELEPGDEPEEQPDPEENPDDAGEEQPSVSFEGEESEPETDNSAIRQMRTAMREKDKRIAELEKASAPKPIEIGPKPELWSDEIVGDEELYDKRMDEWRDRRAAANRQNETQAEQSRKANEEWQQDIAAFEQEKAALDFEDRDEAIEAATLSLDMVQQAVIVKAAAKPALFMVALGKSEAKRAELAKIHDPIKLAAAVARMEGAVEVTRKAPAPDRAQRGSAAMPIVGGEDKELARLEKEADKPPYDRTAVIAYKNALKAAAAEAKK